VEGSGGVGWLGEVPMADQNPKRKKTLLCGIKVHRRWREAVTCGDVGP